MKENPEQAISDLVAAIKAKSPGDVVPWREIEIALGCPREDARFKRRLRLARQRLKLEDVEVDGYGQAKGAGLRVLAPNELFEKTGSRIRSIRNSAKRALETCGIAASRCTSNSQIRAIAGRAAVASAVAEKTYAKAVQHEIEKDHAPPLSPRQIFAMREKPTS